MADEIRNANVIRVQRDGPRWCALIGPDLQRGVAAFGRNPVSALWGLVYRLARCGWCFDDSWREPADGRAEPLTRETHV